MTAKIFMSDINDLYQSYLAGKTTVELAKELGCHSMTIRNAFKRNGFAIRNGSEVGRLTASKLTRDERLAKSKAAHDAVRGTHRSFKDGCKRAIGVEISQPAMTDTERLVYDVLVEYGFMPLHCRACGIYNIDFTIGHTVAVEVFGGGWHSSGRAAARHQQRIRYLLDAGWNVVILWVADGVFHSREALNEIIALNKITSRDPSTLRQYRVVWSDGKIVYTCTANDNNFSLKPAFECARDLANGRYYRVA